MPSSRLSAITHVVIEPTDLLFSDGTVTRWVAVLARRYGLAGQEEAIRDLVTRTIILSPVAPIGSPAPLPDETLAALFDEVRAAVTRDCGSPTETAAAHVAVALRAERLEQAAPTPRVHAARLPAVA